MKSRKKSIVIMLAILVLACLSVMPISKIAMDIHWMFNEATFYNQTVGEFLEAIDNRDKTAVKNMFSEDIKQKDKELDKKIDQLFQVYSGPTDKWYAEDFVGGAFHFGSTFYKQSLGEREYSAYNFFPVVCNDKYYWCCLNLMYINDKDESKVGITEVDFYTADQWLRKKSVDKKDYGLEVHFDDEYKGEIRSINCVPVEYKSSGRILTEHEVTVFFNLIKNKEASEFLGRSNKFSEFQKYFGKPVGKGNGTEYYYELEKENDEPRYLVLDVDEEKDEIYFAVVVNEFENVRVLLESDL